MTADKREPLEISVNDEGNHIRIKIGSSAYATLEDCQNGPRPSAHLDTYGDLDLHYLSTEDLLRLQEVCSEAARHLAGGRSG